MEYLHIIDDDLKLLSLWKDIFEMEGYVVLTYDTFAKFKRNYINKGIEVIILDLNLKQDSGLDLFKSFQKMGIFSPVILSSGHLEVNNTEEFLCLGGFRVFQKGVESQFALLRKLRIAFENARNNYDINIHRANFSKGIKELTNRQKEVFNLMLKGFSVHQTAEYLGTSNSNITAHRTEIFRKTGVDNVNDLKLFCSQINYKMG